MKQVDFEENIQNNACQADNLTEERKNEPVEQENQNTESDQTDNMAAELNELKDSYLRLMAEYDNYRKRTLKEKADLIKNGGEKVLFGLLPVVDDFERAVNNLENATDIQAVAEGIRLIYTKFMAFLNQNGVKPIESIGSPFNEDLFDAVAIVPAPEEQLKGKVIDCVQAGYKINDKVLRHAKVVVGE
ncbi:MAG: nucleotide exchange factor GrpE [Dysgonamonadaceae bacterium]|jgi:molecular chaperone GrpE|nr:nucleotide exchange factor GrpE [Dysgonamonadaceae bacterium]